MQMGRMSSGGQRDAEMVVCLEEENKSQSAKRRREVKYGKGNFI
jgi:hypothetical protein